MLEFIVLSLFVLASMSQLSERSMTESFLLDTCVSTLILNGELWQRSPATLMGSRVDIYAAWRFSNEVLAKVGDHHLELEKSIKAYQWAVERQVKGAPPLYISPTVQEEMQHSDQVFTLLIYVIVMLNIIVVLHVFFLSFPIGPNQMTSK